MFLILQLPNIISTIRSNNQHQRFTQQILPKPQTLLTTDHIRSPQLVTSWLVNRAARRIYTQHIALITTLFARIVTNC